MPRNPNEPPPLNPSPADVGKGGLREHLDNTNLNNPSNPQEYKDIARLAGQNTGSDQNNTSGSSNPTVTITGDLSGSKQVAPGTQLMDVVSNIDSNFKDYKYERVDGSSVDLSFEVKGDVTVVAKSNKSDSSKSGSEETKPPEEKPVGNTSQQNSTQQRRS